MKDFLERIYYTPENGLVEVTENPATECIAEWYHIKYRAKKIEADYVLFRRFYAQETDQKPVNAKPMVYIFRRNHITEEEHATLHKKIWSANEIDTYAILDRTEIQFFNARHNFNSLSSLKDLALCAKQSTQDFDDSRFSALVFAQGTFWEQKEKGIEFDSKRTPFHKLLEHLNEARTKLFNVFENEIHQKAIDKLFLLCILVKFLESKKDTDGRCALDNIYKNFEVATFADILRKGGEVFFQFLQELATIQKQGASEPSKNGKIFDILQNERGFIESMPTLQDFIDFVEGQMDKKTGQFSIWQQYDFDYLPIELISAIYEEFLNVKPKPKPTNKKRNKKEEAKDDNNAEKGVVYTPLHLVNFMIDEVMPLDLPASHYWKDDKICYKILDPSCGSGVFLVSAYKRLLDWWHIEQEPQGTLSSKTSEEKAEDFREILARNIFGVDENTTATQITIFSLTIAFLDRINPKEVWDNLQKQDLGSQNIKDKNFFEWAVDAPKDFDLVIGNPPFNVPSEYDTRKNKGVEVKKPKDYIIGKIQPYYEALKKEFGFEYLAPVPDGLAFYFLEFTRLFSKNKTICLIIPSTLLLYSPQGTNITYRTNLLAETTVKKVYDFTHLRETLFSKNNTETQASKNNGRTPVCTLIIENKPNDARTLEHIVVKRLTTVEEKIRFEIDHYDKHTVRLDWASKHPFIWKCNLLGGGRLFHLILRLSSMQNLAEFIEAQQEKNSEWIFQDGYHSPIEGDDIPTIDYIFNRHKITAIKDNKLIIGEKEHHKAFKRPRPDILYKLPLLVLQKKIGEGLLPLGIQKEFNDEYLVFQSNFVGIHAPKEEFGTLQKIYDRFQETKTAEAYMMWILATSSSAMVGQETAIKKRELETLPFPDFDDEEELELSDFEIILREDVLNHYKHLGKAISHGSDGYKNLERKLNVKKDKEVLDSFGDTFCKALNQLYAKNGKSWQVGKVLQTEDTNRLEGLSEGFIIYQLGFGVTHETRKIDMPEEILKELIYKKTRSAVWVRIGRFYAHQAGYDCVFLIKPSNIRYWLRSIALRDAGQTLSDLQKNGF